MAPLIQYLKGDMAPLICTCKIFSSFLFGSLLFGGRVFFVAGSAAEQASVPWQHFETYLDLGGAPWGRSSNETSPSWLHLARDRVPPPRNEQVIWNTPNRLQILIL